MTAMMNDMIMELDPEELGAVSGGDSADAFTEYADYVDTLYDTYNCRGMGLKHLKTLCTPEEKARIREMRRIVTAAAGVNNN